MGGNRVVMLGQPASQAVRLKQGGGVDDSGGSQFFAGTHFLC
jgi:hypothetical protein